MRKKAIHVLEEILSIHDFLIRVLELAVRFIPCQAASILLDDPLRKKPNPHEGVLVFVATYGPEGKKLLNKEIPAHQGIAGYVYCHKQTYWTNNPYQDPFFNPSWDEITGFKTRSLAATPIRIEQAVCGVLEIINTIRNSEFSEDDMKLLEVFADYTSLALRGFLDGRRAQEIARRDELTGLYNDRYFHTKLLEDLQKAQETGGDVVLLFIDLDNFKSINDTYGHLAGSQSLREVGYLLRDLIQLPSATVARYGGDEFVVILPEVTHTTAEKIAQAIISAIRDYTFLSRPFGWHHAPLNIRGVISCSIGLASFRDDLGTWNNWEDAKDRLIRCADTAMYHAKAKEKGSWEWFKKSDNSIIK